MGLLRLPTAATLAATSGSSFAQPSQSGRPWEGSLTGLLLATLLNLAPGIRLADNFVSRNIALHDERHTPPFYSEADELPPHVVEELSPGQLKGVLLILEQKRPTYLVSGLLITSGLLVGAPAGLFAYSLFNTLSGSANLFSAFVTVYLAGILAAVAIAGGIVALVGLALVVVRWFQRRSYTKVEDRVRARLQLLEPRPPQANSVFPRAMQTVMTF